MQRILRLFRNLVFSFNILAALLSILVYIAPYVHPETFWQTVFLPYLSFPMLLIHLGFIIWWSLGRSKKVLLSLITVVLGWPVNNATVQWSPGTKSSENSLTIMSYNVGNFREGGEKKATHENIRQIINSTQPDLICFQEYQSRNRKTGDFSDILFDELDYQQGYFEKVIGNADWGFSGLAIFSKYPILSKNYLPFQNEHTVNGCIYVDVLVGIDTVRVINIHLQTNRLQREELEYVRGIQVNPDAESGRGILKVMAKIKAAALARASQAETVAALIDSTPYPILLCGDFNDLPASYAYHQVKRHLQDSFVKKGNGTGNTYAGVFPSFRIDQVFVDPRFKVKTHRVIKQRHSDHFPVVVTLEIPQP
ncbi:MAG: endonuclease/exonuclease/phosphatase family protein [Sphingobacteriaceae bacterium]|nr:endonuclease/exonuclease/phosphatase family protein [Sphingobacteriaceae bacterium]